MSTNFVKFNALQAGKALGARVLTNTVKQVAKNARTSITGGNATTKPFSLVTKRKSNGILAYPFTVDEDDQQGHYILFHIYDQVKGGKLATTRNKNKKSGKKLSSDLLAELNIRDQQGDISSKTLREAEQDLQLSDPLAQYVIGNLKTITVDGTQSSRGSDFRSLQLTSGPDRERQKTIALYMPAQVEASYQVSYGEQEIGALAMAGQDALAALMAPGDMLTRLTRVYNTLVGSGGEGIDVFIQGAAETVASGARALIQINKGTVITPRMELMFEGVGRREFSFTFTMIPKHEDEAKMINEIIYNFKRYMMPEYENQATRREMRIPATFEIKYMYHGSENDYLNKISTCFLKTVDVKYGGDNYSTHELAATSRGGSGLPPQKTELVLNFAELETMHRGLVESGH